MRKKAGLTQGDLAELCGVTGATISRWETGKTPIPLDKVGDLADALNVSAHDIREFRGAGDDTAGNYVNSRLDAFRWLMMIAQSELGIEARALAAAPR